MAASAGDLKVTYALQVNLDTAAAATNLRRTAAKLIAAAEALEAKDQDTAEGDVFGGGSE